MCGLAALLPSTQTGSADPPVSSRDGSQRGSAREELRAVCGGCTNPRRVPAHGGMPLPGLALIPRRQPHTAADVASSHPAGILASEKIFATGSMRLA